MKILHTKCKNITEQEKKRFVDIYIKVFGAPPRKEVLDREKIYNELFNENYFISILSENKQIVGFIISTPIEYFPDANFSKEEKNIACYISELALLSETRGKGAGKKLLLEHINYLSDFFKIIYTRSRTDIENVVGLYINCGFNIIKTYDVITNDELSTKHIYKRIL